MEDYNIYTIGYGNMIIQDFLESLNKFDIKLLIDVRGYPKSKWNADYNLLALKAHLTKNGIEYKWYKELRGYVNHKSIKYYYRLKDIILLSSKKNVVIMCSELNPNRCHRYIKLTPDIEKKKEVKHIYKNEIIDPKLIVDKNKRKEKQESLQLFLL